MIGRTYGCRIIRKSARKASARCAQRQAPGLHSHPGERGNEAANQSLLPAAAMPLQERRNTGAVHERQVLWRLVAQPPAASRPVCGRSNRHRSIRVGHASERRCHGGNAPPAEAQPRGDLRAGGDLAEPGVRRSESPRVSAHRHTDFLARLERAHRHAWSAVARAEVLTQDNAGQRARFPAVRHAGAYSRSARPCSRY